MSSRPLFSSRLAAILTMIGVSVGLGNVWRFPYMMGKFGGSAFLIVYLLFTLLLAIPAVIGEWGLGRETRQGPFGAFTAAFGAGAGKIVGSLLMLTVLVANSYYLIVVGNVVYSFLYSGWYGFSQDTLARYERGLALTPLQYGVALTLLGGGMFVLYRGLKRGIEVVSKAFVPFFGLVMCYLVVHTLLLPGAAGELLQFIYPRFDQLNAQSIFGALGQAFFSLGLGGTFMLIYGSYLTPSQNLTRSALLTGAGDAGAALLASLFIVPAVLVFGLDMASGPGLLFSTLPRLFIQLPAGQLVGTLFLVSLAMVAFLSSVASLEVLVGGLHDSKFLGQSRNQLILAVGAAEAVLMFPSAYRPELIGVLDLVFGSGMQVLGSALALIALAWGLRHRPDAVFSRRAGRFLFHWIKWVVPPVLFVILAGYVRSLM